MATINTRTDLINYLITRFGYKSYLELGLADGENYNRIQAADKTGVDIYIHPNVKGGKIYNMTTDKFFESLDSGVKYDIIFIDAEHICDPFRRDVKNSLNHLAERGTIVCHDCNPITFERQIDVFKGGAWNGTV